MTPEELAARVRALNLARAERAVERALTEPERCITLDALERVRDGPG